MMGKKWREKGKEKDDKKMIEEEKRNHYKTRSQGWRNLKVDI